MSSRFVSALVLLRSQNRRRYCQLLSLFLQLPGVVNFEVGVGSDMEIGIVSCCRKLPEMKERRTR